MNNIVHFIKRFLAGLKVGSNPWQKVKGALGMVFITFISELEFEIKIFGRTSKIFLHTGSDAAVMAGVFLDNEYEMPEDFHPKTILDLGANIGMASLYFSLRYPEASIVSVEPDPGNIPLLKKNTQGKKVQIVQGAVDTHSGKRTFHTVRGQGMSSSFIQRFSADSIEVDTYSINDLLKNTGFQHFDLIKFDVEGAEFEVFENLNPKKSDIFVGEYHADLTHRSVGDFVKLFSSYKSKVEMVNKNRSIVTLYSSDVMVRT